MKSVIHRRAFIKSGSTAIAGFYIIPNYRSRLAPSDRVSVAHIGVNGMGQNHIDWFAELPSVQTAALCDVDSVNLGMGMEALMKANPQANAKTYSDFRKILERKDIDAITCATPDHWHAQIAIMAFEAGKDVYGEKPLSFSAREGKRMLKSQQKHQRIFQLGTQIHAGDNYHRVVEIIKSGALGKIHSVRLWKTSNPPVLPFTTDHTVPSTLNWDFWQGPAPAREYTKERTHLTYRYFLDYSGGVFQDFWCHIADIVWWSINPQGLTNISSRGEKVEGQGDTPGWIDIDYQFNDLKLYWTSKQPELPNILDGHIGAYFEGANGTLCCNYTDRIISIHGQVMKDIDSVPIGTIPRSPGHQQNFIDSVKSRKQPESNLEYVRKMTLPMHLGLISWRLSRPLEWNEKKEKFKKDKEANLLLDRKYRKAYDWI